jgi:putative PIN family toxin of toxin-antitoxin system
MIRVVIDTNVLVAALRSNMGASHALVSLLPSEKFHFCLSVPLYIEYKTVLTRPDNMSGRSSAEEIIAFLRYLCRIACHQKIFYLWRPWLRDPKDDMVLELAVAAKCQYIITYNLKDFANIQQFGITAIPPGTFLKILAEGEKWAAH